jgi:hypothetical protein
MLKQSLFRKHDFAAYVCRIYQDYHKLCFQHLKIFSNGSHGYRRKEISKPNRSEFYSGGKALIFSSDELHPYASADLHKQLGGVGHCFAWHVQVSLGFYFKF